MTRTLRMPAWMDPARGNTRLLLLTAAIIALGVSLQISNGAQHPDAMQWLLAALVCVPVGLAVPRLPFVDRFVLPIVPWLAVIGIAVFLAIHLIAPPGMYLQRPVYDGHHLYVASAALAIGYGLARPSYAALGALVVAFLAAGAWLLRASPTPAIDVVMWHKKAYEALGKGICPYSISIPNIYGHTRWYAAGTADAMNVYRGYLYPPLALFLGAPGHWLFGDYRYANLAALAAGGFLVGAARTRLAIGAAALFLFAPRMFFVLEQGWTEATALFMLALSIYAAFKWPRALPYVFGAMCVSKQYMVLLAPLFPFLLPRPWKLREIGVFALRAAIAGAVLTLPLALWDFKGFWKAVVEYQGIQPYRPDSLSLMAWLGTPDGAPGLPKWASFATIPVVWIVAWLRAPKSAGGFALAAALQFLLFFATAKQAFCNYYFMVAGTLCIAIGAFELSDVSSRPALAGAAERDPTADSGTPT